jgi:hypothetical protein
VPRSEPPVLDLKKPFETFLRPNFLGLKLAMAVRNWKWLDCRVAERKGVGGRADGRSLMDVGACLGNTLVLNIPDDIPAKGDMLCKKFIFKSLSVRSKSGGLFYRD